MQNLINTFATYQTTQLERTVISPFSSIVTINSKLYEVVGRYVFNNTDTTGHSFYVNIESCKLENGKRQSNASIFNAAFNLLDSFIKNALKLECLMNTDKPENEADLISYYQGIISLMNENISMSIELGWKKREEKLARYVSNYNHLLNQLLAKKVEAEKPAPAATTIEQCQEITIEKLIQVVKTCTSEDVRKIQYDEFLVDCIVYNAHDAFAFLSDFKDKDQSVIVKSEKGRLEVVFLTKRARTIAGLEINISRFKAAVKNALRYNNTEHAEKLEIQLKEYKIELIDFLNKETPTPPTGPGATPAPGKETELINKYTAELSDSLALLEKTETTLKNKNKGEVTGLSVSKIKRDIALIKGRISNIEGIFKDLGLTPFEASNAANTQQAEESITEAIKTPGNDNSNQTTKDQPKGFVGYEINGNKHIFTFETKQQSRAKFKKMCSNMGWQFKKHLTVKFSDWSLIDNKIYAYTIYHSATSIETMFLSNCKDF